MDSHVQSGPRGALAVGPYLCLEFAGQGHGVAGIQGQQRGAHVFVEANHAGEDGLAIL